MESSFSESVRSIKSSGCVSDALACSKSLGVSTDVALRTVNDVDRNSRRQGRVCSRGLYELLQMKTSSILGLRYFGS
jgi:hypothetical protein